MNRRKCAVFFTVLISFLVPLSFVATNVDGGDVRLSAQRSFSDADLRKYSAPRDRGGAPEEAGQSKPADAAPEPKPQADRQYWCDTATRYRQEVEQARQDLSRAQEDERLANDVILYQKQINETTLEALNSARDAVGEARRRIQAAEENLKAFEEDARAKSIPPGWLECRLD